MSVLEGLENWIAGEKDKLKVDLKGLPRPMLASNLVERGVSRLGELKYPCYASFKIDGYRCLIWHGRAWTRSGKEHEARGVRELARALEDRLHLGDWALDGELIVPGQNFSKAGGWLRRQDFRGPLRYVIYDLVAPGLGFRTRLDVMKHMQGQLEEQEARGLEHLPLRWLRHWWVENEQELLDLEQAALEHGDEGLCTRDPYAEYKHKRGTLRDQCLLKLKRWDQAEAKVIGVLPRMENLNPQEEQAWGLTKRSSAQDGLVETDALGALEVVGINGPWAGVEFRVGSFLGLDDEDKREAWRNREQLNGQILTYKWLPIGSKDKPRHPVFLGWRPDWDLGQEEEQEDKSNG